MLKISIIMPVHDQIKFTQKAIESLCEFTDPEAFELIVIDNGSRDKLSLPVERDNLTILRNEGNLGWCKALNQGIARTSSDFDFILWANNDLLFEKDWLPKMIAHFRPGIGAVGPTSNYVMGRQRTEIGRGEYEEEVQWLIGFFLMFRRGVIDAVGPVDERFSPGGSEEWDYIIRMQQRLGLKCVIARDVYIHHFGSQTLKATIARTAEEYSDYHQGRDRLLREKWGEDFIEQWIPQKISTQSNPSPYPWPDNCKLGFAIPHTWTNINYNTHLSLMAMIRPPMEIIDAASGGELDSKREYQVEVAINAGCTHLLIGDGDMRYPKEILIDLFKILNDGADIAGGLCYRGYPPYEPIVWHPTEEHRMLLPFKDFKFGDVIDAGATGAACLLVPIRIFRELARPWFRYRVEKVINDKSEEGAVDVADIQSEDFYFTRKATRAGFKLRIHTRYDVDHLREFPINRDLWLTHAILSRCKDWATIIALYKKLGDRQWIDRELRGATTEIDWEINQRPYEIGLLYNFLAGKQIRTVLEIGTEKGGTALLWAKLVDPRRGRIYCVDRSFSGEAVYQKHPLKDRITEIEGDSHAEKTIEAVKEIISQNGGPVDFAFIDGDHTYQGVKADFADYSELVRPGGWIAFHDILDTEFQRQQNCHVARFWKEMKGRYNHFEIIDPDNRRDMGIGVIEWKKGG